MINIGKKNPGTETDETLVSAFLSGDGRAFDMLVLRYKDMVFNLCFRMMGDCEEADDCAQEVFLKIYNGLPGFKFKAAFTTWLYRIAVNTCNTRLTSADSKRSRKTMSLSGTAGPASHQTVLDIRDDSSDPAGDFERHEIQEAIQEALNELPSLERTLVVLRDIEGRSYEEIAEITDIHLGTVKSKLSRARQKLRCSLRGVI